MLKWMLCFSFFFLFLLDSWANAQQRMKSTFRRGNVRPFGGAQSNGPDLIRVFLQLDSSSTQTRPSQSRFSLQSSPDTIYEFDEIDALVATFSSQQIEALQQDDEILNITIDHIRKIPEEPTQIGNILSLNEASNQQQPNLDVIQIPDAHFLTRGKGTRVCIIDSGISANHVDLDRSKLRGVRGRNFLSWDQDEFGHGTHVGGIIAAKTDNDLGIQGIAPESDIFIIRVVRDANNDFAYSSDILNAAIQCVRRGAQIIVMALAGQDPSEAEERGLNDIIKDRNVLIVAPTGNGGPLVSVQYPSGYPNILSVGAVSNQGFITRLTQVNEFVDLVAPGQDILSLFPNDGFVTQSGTSMACAHVAGVAALLWSTKPDATVDEIKNALFTTASDRGVPGRDDFFGHGIVQAWDAISFLLRGTGPSTGMSSPSFQDRLTLLIQLRSPATTFEDSTSPQSLALDWMVMEDDFAQSSLFNSPDRLVQRFALVTLWYATGGPTTWDENGHGWLNARTAECEWNSNDFASCSSDGFVTSLLLAFDGLSGSLPLELGLLTTLARLELFGNRLTGRLPIELSELTALTRLRLDRNEFIGDIPIELSKLASLGLLSLDTNNLEGTLPSTLCSNVGIFGRGRLRPRIDCGEIECDCCDDANQNPCP